MRHELFVRGIIRPEAFEEEVRKTAIESQAWEGLTDPDAQEPADVWQVRLERIRDNLTDLRFSQNLSFEIYEAIISSVLNERGIDVTDVKDLIHAVNLELVPMELVFEHAEDIERLPYEERRHLEHRLEEARIVLIRTLISDQMRYINVARRWITISDLAEIRSHKIGPGRIGGKAAGMLLAYRILTELTGETGEDVCLSMPKSYYVGSGEFYTFMAVNELGYWSNQKYKTEDKLRAEYPQIVDEFERRQFPADTNAKLRVMLDDFGKKPLIVRSSSLLEDSFNTSFAGKYESIFLPNQGTPDENLSSLVRAMARIYASTFNPASLLYRRLKGLLDYDERMALLIQEVQGQKFGRYYLPYVAGVAFSRNMYRWAPKIRREDGFMRLVWGLGTRAVDRVGYDYPRMVALSHPELRPAKTPREILRYSQHEVDLLDLEANELKTLTVHDVLDGRYPNLRYLVQVDEGGYFSTRRTRILDGDKKKLVLTFNELLRSTNLADRMRDYLRMLEDIYNFPVDVEFTMHLERMEGSKLMPCITVLQCRPQSHLDAVEKVALPEDLKKKDIVLSTNYMVPEGYIDRVDFIIFVPPEGYFSLPTQNDRSELRRAIGRLNAAMENERFILVGPGRWGSSNSDLGVPLDYGDFYNSRALVELTGQGIGAAPEPSLGTHFFQDLMESQIYPLAIYLDDSKTIMARRFFYNMPNHLADYDSADNGIQECLRLIRVSDYRKNHFLRIVMNEEKSQATAFLVKDEKENS